MLYHSDLYDRTQSVGSYWETTVGSPPMLWSSLKQQESCEVAIIGGGITGLSAAYHLAQQGIDVRLLDAGTPAWGASGRNGGFCCTGASRLSNHALIQQFGQDATRQFFRNQRQGIELVTSLAEQESIDIEAQGQGYIQVAHHPSRWAELEDEYEFLTQVAEFPCTLWSKKDLVEQGFTNSDTHAALHVTVGFGLNPMKYSRGLANAVRHRGVSIYAHSPVEAWDKDGAWHCLHTPGGTLRAKSVVVATNGYTQDTLYPGLSDRLLPVISSIITTRPLTPDELEAHGWRTETPVWDTRALLSYYRLLKDGRFLFGSRGGTRGGKRESDRHRAWMIRRFAAMFPAWKDIEITHFWNGFVCLSASLTPHIGRFDADASVLYGLAYHGNGVAMGTWTGRAIAQLLVDPASETQLCPVFRQPLKRFPLAPLRVWYLRSAYAAYRIQDALP